MASILLETLLSAIFITGLVVVMMMLIEICNIGSGGRLLTGLNRSKAGQILVSSLLGTVPGCMGGFASVSLYTHKMLSFGALLAMMVATAGDEAFMMLALFPGKACLIFAFLLILGIVVGFVVELFPFARKQEHFRLDDTFEIHESDHGHQHGHEHGHSHSHHHEAQESHHHEGSKTFGVIRLSLLLGMVLFIAALILGGFEQASLWESGVDVEPETERYIFWGFAVLSLVVVGVLLFAPDHFVKEHLWEHVVKHHLPEIFASTLIVLVLVAAVVNFWNPESWIKDNTALMIIIAVLVGCIPQSGPHLVFVTMFATGYLPLSVLLANTVVQEGHAGLPLLAESKSAFLKAKAIKVVLGLAVGFLAMLF